MKKIIFMGTPDFAADILQTLLETKQDLYEVIAVVSQPDKPVGRKRVLMATPVKKIAEAYQLSILQPEKIKDSYDELVKLAPDLIITAAYGQIVPENILNLPTFKCINVHGSLLPKYRGGAPIHYAIMNGESETGITIMYMAKKMDAGDMLYQKAIPITETDTLATMFTKLQKLGAAMLIEMLPDFFNGKIEAKPQAESEVTFSPTIKKEDCFIDWTQDAQTVFNHVRGLSPTPTAFTIINDVQIKLFAVEVISEQTVLEKPGIIVKTGKKECLVATSNGLIALQDIQISGKKRQKIQEVMNGVGRNLFIEGAKFETK